MINFTEYLEKYAALVIEMGVNIQPEQELVIRAPIECAEFTRILTEKAYQKGAKEVIVLWKDEQLSKIKYTYSPLEVFETVPRWQANFFNDYSERGAAFLSIYAEDPELMADVDPQKIIAGIKASRTACQPYYDRLDNGENVWNIVSVPTLAWAKKVFSDCSDEQAIDKLWKAIFKAVRVDTPDPIAAWKQHDQSFRSKVAWLNQQQFQKLRYTNSLGTNLTLGLPQNHIWQGGGETSNKGVFFFPNMPTEEIFSMPHKDHVDGVVVSSMPLNHNGNLIDGFSFTFERGKIVDFTAKQGYDVLKHILETDEGSRYLGEVALVPNHSPISNMGILFYNTLFDENASCHLALGAAYPSCIQDGTTMSKEQQAQKGVNDSANHIDFMVGTEDLNIVGIKADGTEISIFEHGNWSSAVQ